MGSKCCFLSIIVKCEYTNRHHKFCCFCVATRLYSRNFHLVDTHIDLPMTNSTNLDPSTYFDGTLTELYYSRQNCSLKHRRLHKQRHLQRPMIYRITAEQSNMISMVAFFQKVSNINTHSIKTAL